MTQLFPLCQLDWRLVMEVKLWCLVDREVGVELTSFIRPIFKCVHPTLKDKLFFMPKDYYLHVLRCCKSICWIRHTGLPFRLLAGEAVAVSVLV